MKNKRVFLSPEWAGLLIVSGLVPLFSTASEHADQLSLQIDDGLISLVANNVSVQLVLDEIAEQSDLKIVQYIDLDGVRNLSIARQPLPEVLKQLLSDESYQLYQTQVHSQSQSEDDKSLGPDSDILWIFSEGSSTAPAATVFYEELLLQGNVRDRKQAVRGLRKLGTTDAVQSLSLALSDEASAVRDLAFDALASIGDDEALAAIASASMDGDPWIRGEAATALAANDTESAVHYLSLSLEDPNPNVRVFVVEALSDIGGDAAMQVLLSARNDEDPGVQEAVGDALSLLDPDLDL